MVVLYLIALIFMSSFELFEQTSYFKGLDILFITDKISRILDSYFLVYQTMMFQYSKYRFINLYKRVPLKLIKAVCKVDIVN